MKNTYATRFLQTFALAGLLAGAAGLAGAKGVSVSLTGDQEVPAVTTAATGNGKITINDDMTVTGMVKTKGIEGTMAHIHLAEPENGPPIITLEKKSADEWAVPKGSKLTADQLKAFKDGNLYVNVHSDAHKGGEIRTQLKP